MPFNTTLVGGQTKAHRHDVDARWMMAYAAGLGDLNPRYMDTAAQRVIAHPLFPVCLEWPVILDCLNLPGSESVTAEERTRDVHAVHDTELYRPIQAGERLHTTATVIGLTKIKPGAAQTIRLETRSDAGELVCRTYQLGIKRGVDIIGAPAEIDSAPELPLAAGAAEARFDIHIAKEAAHIYTECARIWNPVHTDRAIALAAGLPDIILHGTATMALAVSKIVDEYLNGDPRSVRRIGGRFTAMVLMPSTITVAVQQPSDGVIGYTVFTDTGERAISQGFICCR